MIGAGPDGRRSMITVPVAVRLVFTVAVACWLAGPHTASATAANAVTYPPGLSPVVIAEDVAATVVTSGDIDQGGWTCCFETTGMRLSQTECQ